MLEIVAGIVLDPAVLNPVKPDQAARLEGRRRGRPPGFNSHRPAMLLGNVRWPM
jgi:hypothetical protein